jgi:hypothetical protein
MNTNEEADFDRMRRLFSALNMAHFGSLWFVPEDIWKARHEGTYDENSTRTGHPGCSLRPISGGCSLGPVPLLHGSSKRAGQAVPVSNVLNAEGHTTFFGGLPPVFVLYTSWQGRNRIRPAHKTRLSDDEEVSVMKLCIKKGWL